MNFRTPIGQVAFLVILSCIIGFGSNLVRADKIPWIAVKLVTAESIDKDVETGESVLVAISLEQAIILFEQGILFVDARDKGYYNTGHIQGALQNDAFLPKLIIDIEERQNKSDALVVYCGDPGCGDSENLAYDLQYSGFTRIYVFKGGWLEWSKAGYPSETGI